MTEHRSLNINADGLVTSFGPDTTVMEPEKVIVKALEWVFDYVRENVWYGNAPIPPHYRASGNVWWIVGAESQKFVCDSLDEAKAAAQADFASRILSCIEAGPGAAEAREADLHRQASSLAKMLAEWFGVEPNATVMEGAADVTYLRLKRLSPIGGEAEPVAFQDRVAAAHLPLFHDDPTDLAERRDRFGEEANEVQQALGQTREGAHQLVDYTYDRAVGEPEKEIGAAALTLASLCVIGGWDMMACAEADLAALQTPEKIAKVRAKRATRHGRGPLPGFDARPQQGEAK